MKKLMMIIAILALSCGAFAATYGISDWGASPMANVNVTDVPDNGFEVSTTADNFLLDFLGFVNEGEEWLYDPNEEVSLTIYGLDSLGEGYVICRLSNEDMGTVTDWQPLNETGEYTFFTNGSKLTDGLSEGDEIVAVMIGISSANNGDGIVASYTVPGGLSFTANNFVTAPIGEQEETEVPEPATYAYAAMGLVSAFGLKRRIRK